LNNFNLYILNAPIALFLYNRPLHATVTVKSLLKCKEAQVSDLYIFCDGPRQSATINDLEAIKNVRNFAEKIVGFNSIKMIFHENNLGLSQSIIFGINNVLEKHQTVIVIEDDVVVGDQFLNFINSGLQKYQGNSAVAGITGYSFPFKINEPYFTRTGACWGWATYKNVWQSFIKERKSLNLNQIETGERVLFNVFENYYEKMFIQNKDALVDSWAIDFYLYYFVNKMYFLMPGKNLVNNIGFDGSGAHKKNGNFLINNNPTVVLKKYKLPDLVEEDTLIRKKIIQLYHNGMSKPSMLNKIINKIKRKLNLK